MLYTKKIPGDLTRFDVGIFEEALCTNTYLQSSNKLQIYRNAGAMTIAQEYGLVHVESARVRKKTTAKLLFIRHLVWKRQKLVQCIFPGHALERHRHK